MYQYTACKSAVTKHIILCIIPDPLKHSQHKTQHIFITQTDLGTRNFKSASITRLATTLKLVVTVYCLRIRRNELVKLWNKTKVLVGNFTL